MPNLIEDYALIGDCHTGALVGRDGSIDWLCFPRFDSPACFTALLGSPEHGRWLVRPEGEVRSTRRRYRGDTLILETDIETDEGAVTLIEFMPPRSEVADVVRIVIGREGKVRMEMELVARFDYGSVCPWIHCREGNVVAVAGPDAIYLRCRGLELREDDLNIVSRFEVAAGEQVSMDVAWQHSHLPPPDESDHQELLEATEAWWKKWSGKCTYKGPWRAEVMRSLITLKALTYAPTGGILAALTTSLPETIGGERNWDYRFCWLRDAAFTLQALVASGYTNEACGWRDWLLRAVAGKPSQIQPLYGLAGERRLIESELSWLPGYENSRPVRIGNDAYKDLQIDIFGQVMDTLYLAHSEGLRMSQEAWRMDYAAINHLETIWDEPDEGIWEVRGARQHFTHSKVMAWVAMDRAVKEVERFGVKGPVERWRKLRDTIHEDVCRHGFNKELGAFTQAYGSRQLDASLLVIPLVDFLPAEDPRVRGTVEAIEQNLTRDGLVLRYDTSSGTDGLSGEEGCFLLCSFWLVDNLWLLGRRDDACRMFDHLLSLANDVGLMAEEYDPKAGRQVGNFPQAFSHVALVNTAQMLTGQYEHLDEPVAAR